MGQQQGDRLLHCGEEKASEFAPQAAWNAAHYGAGEGQCGFRLDCLHLGMWNLPFVSKVYCLRES